MVEQTKKQGSALRMQLALAGALAGLSLWFLIDPLSDWLENERLYLFLFTGTLAGFALMLAMTGPLSLRRAGLLSSGVAVLAAGLLTWSSFRFADIGDFLDPPDAVGAAILGVTLMAPFLIAASSGAGRWRYYPALFCESWNIVVRYAAAWVFVGLFWGVLFLSSALFNVIGLNLIEDLLEFKPAPYVITGFVLGLALAVMHELADYVSPFLILRLLRLLLPVVLVVFGIFILSLPLTGLSGIFEAFSAAATMLAMAISAIILVTTAIDQSDEAAVQTRLMVLATQALVLLIPVMAVLAAYAIWVRVGQYGWTPDRLIAATFAGFTLAFAGAYAVAVGLRRGWMGRIRRINVYLAIGMILVSVLWLTPVLNPQRISTLSQVSRFESGKIPADDLDLWEIGRVWGKAGQKGIERLAALSDHPEAEVLAQRLAKLEKSDTRFAFARGEETDVVSELAAQLGRKIAVRPQGAELPETLFSDLSRYTLERWNAGCELRTPLGRPACLIVLADLVPYFDGQEALVLFMAENLGVQTAVLTSDGTGYSLGRSPRALSGRRLEGQQAALIDEIYDNGVSVEPTRMKALRIKDSLIFIEP